MWHPASLLFHLPLLLLLLLHLFLFPPFRRSSTQFDVLRYLCESITYVRFDGSIEIIRHRIESIQIACTRLLTDSEMFDVRCMYNKSQFKFTSFRRNRHRSCWLLKPVRGHTLWPHDDYLRIQLFWPIFHRQFDPTCREPLECVPRYQWKKKKVVFFCLMNRVLILQSDRTHTSKWLHRFR